jgi:twitching motility protein PilU
MDITPFFKLMVDKNASDLFFTVDAPVNMKVEGITHPVGQAPLTSQQSREMAYSIMTDKQQKEFDEMFELNMALSLKGLGRFRVNVFKQKGEVAMVIRYIKGEIPSIESLHLPPILKEIIMEMRGLILVVGATSSGKSTSLASMIDYRNTNHRGHILTIEDPIEFIHEQKKSIVDQREVGLDTHSFDNALKNAMRQAPEVILIGEIRDMDRMQNAISYAETGHLCISTLHANNANQAMDRVINFFPEEARRQLLIDLSLNLKAIISQRLIPGEKHKRVPAVEVLINSPYISDLIEKNKIEEIKEVMARSKDVGMQTFDQALFDLYQSGDISQENALKFADSKNNLSLQIRMSQEHNFDDDSDLALNKDDDDHGGLGSF